MGLRHLVERRLRLLERRLGLLELGDELVGVDAGQHLALLHMVVEIGIELVDLAGHFRTDIDLVARRQRARGADIDRKRPAGDGPEDIGMVRLAAAHGIEADAGDEQDGDDPEDPPPPAPPLAVQAEPGRHLLIWRRRQARIVHERASPGTGGDCR